MRLNLHRLLGSHENALSVNVGREVDALFLDSAETCEGEHLESAAVRECGSVPSGKLLQSSEVVDELVSRTDVKVVRV